MITPFLKQVARLFYDQYGADIHHLAFVFPNRRSGIFFRKHLSEVATKPVFSPSILTIDDLFHRLNPKRQADRIKVLFLLYDIYIRQSGSDETFDDFVHWGEMLLNDFDDIDKYLVDAKQLFTNVKDLNVIDKEFSFLKPAQIQAIRSFWSSFQPESDKTGNRFFLHVWELLYPIYAELRNTLAAEGLAYDGLIYREVIENIYHSKDVPDGSSEALHKLNFKKIIFVGLNVLTKAERELLKYLKQQDIADFYWDYASGKLKDEDNRASFFMKENIRMFPSKFALPEEDPVETHFEIIGIPSRIGQAKQLYPILEKLAGNKGMSAEEALQTAIVLPDEQLLTPVLNSIPENIPRINVTLGYSLSGTPVASLMNDLQSLQKNAQKTTEEIRFYHRDVMAVLRHKYVSSVCPEEVAALIKEITKYNRVYISTASLGLAPLLKLLFSAPATTADLSDYLTAILKEMNRYLSQEAENTKADQKEIIQGTGPGGADEETGDDNPKVDPTALEREFIFHYYTMVNRMQEVMRETKTKMSSDTYFRLLKQMTDFIKIPFYGEPLSGLQVMGVLETRVLDFENIILLSMNEGIFPAKNAAGSFIPYHLRKGFGLPTQEHQESIWAYHFYRMIQRARRVIMLYDTRTDGLQSGEVSRFVHQLTYHYQVPVQRKLSVYNISSSHVDPFHVEKNEEIMHALAAFETEKNLSASAINIYLDCPLKFYLSVVKGINEENTVSETLENDTFGTILHRVMELVYKPFCGKVITADLLKLSAQDKNMTEKIREAFAKDFFHTEKAQPLAGQAYLYGEIIRKYVCKVLAYDRSLTPFTYINSEKPIHSLFEIAGGRNIRLKGFIDRIDEIGETLRIIDYKSGKPVALTFDGMESLFDKTARERRKAVMQVFLYAWLYSPEAGGKPLQPAVYYTRDLFKQANFDPAIRRVDGRDKTLINNFDDYRQEFEDNLRTCLNEIFDARTPFTQAQNAKVCEYCPFTDICGR
ncbi:MAG: PD-(D/E)XK nuclease family protein [Tannerella sp.]|jgi:hypothetical protein|nr:PD-(D/E)XK nuclease family protein [Tannerella sp.]